PSTRAAISNRVASTSPCTSSGCGRTRYQIDKAATTATTPPTTIAGRRVGEGANFFDSALGLPVSPRISGVSGRRSVDLLRADGAGAASVLSVGIVIANLRCSPRIADQV